MQHTLLEYLYLILIILGLVLLAYRIKIAYPIVLVLGGLLLSFTVEFSRVWIDPEIIFLIFLPPLLYEAAMQTSWKEFWKFRRVIMSFAFPLVIITSTIIAIFAHSYLPGFTLALGFLLGGIISPPDAVSATTIMRQVNAPKSLVSVIEGESLLNDASSLIVVRFALAAVLTGQFSLEKATIDFVLVIVMGVLIGLGIGLLFYFIYRWLRLPSNVETVLTLLAPYIMYYCAEHFEFSGVLAVVSGGLYLSSRRLKMLSYKSRMEGVNVWSNLVFVLNGFIFLLIGLQLPLIVQELGDTSLNEAIRYALVISGVLIITRILCTFGAAWFTILASRFIRVANANPGWKSPLIAGWAGMRGVVSLAAAMSIPLYLSGDQAFPQRNLILFITFVVILVTLVLQGLTLPWLIRKIDMKEEDEALSEDEQNRMILRQLSEYCLEWLRLRHAEAREKNPYVSNLYEKLRTDIALYDQQHQSGVHQDPDVLREYRAIYLEMLEEQRKWLSYINRSTELSDELIRKHLALLDMEEYKVREKYPVV
jgi:Na+/H+ antiporter